MKYFFLSDGWTTGRIWEFGGLWSELAWNRKPFLQKQPLYIQENGENLWLYKTEEAVLMVEVMPKAITKPTIGQVVLKRLLTADQVVERLCTGPVFHPEQPRQSNETGNKPEETRSGVAPQSTKPDLLITDMPTQPPSSQSSSPSVMTRLRQFAKRTVTSRA